MRNKQTLEALRKLAKDIGDTSNKTMIEIGCYAGESTEVWCNTFKFVHCIDPWLDGKGYDPNDTASIRMSDDIERQFDRRLSAYDNHKKYKNFSYDVHELFEDGSLDFVYIDGEHTYKGVKKDIELFLPKIKPNGFIGGHDFKPKWKGVMDAVIEHFGQPHHVYSDSSWLINLGELK